MKMQSQEWARLTFDNADKLLHVVVCFPVVNHRSDREDQLGLNLGEPVQNALQPSATSERRLKTTKIAQKVNSLLTNI